jgi:hypothetical protein
MRKAWMSAALVPAFLLLAAPLLAQQRAPTADTHVVVCSGTFAKDSSEDELTTDFTQRTSYSPMWRPMTARKSQLRYCFLTIPSTGLRCHLIVIGGQSPWTAPGGMRLGQTLEQVEKFNQKPFKLKGYDKNRIATVSSWDGGALATLPGGCAPGLSLHANPKTSAEAIGALPADKEYSSSDPAIRATKATISEILIGY